MLLNSNLAAKVNNYAYAIEIKTKTLNTNGQDLTYITIPTNGVYLIIAQIAYEGTTAQNKDITLRVYNSSTSTDWGTRKVYAGKQSDTMGAGEITFLTRATNGVKGQVLRLQAKVSATSANTSDCRIFAIRLI